MIKQYGWSFAEEKIAHFFKHDGGIFYKSFCGKTNKRVDDDFDIDPLSGDGICQICIAKIVIDISEQFYSPRAFINKEILGGENENNLV